MELNGGGELFIDEKSVGHVDGLTLSIQRLNDSLERLGSAFLAATASEWPDEIIEDLLDAEVIG